MGTDNYNDEFKRDPAHPITAYSVRELSRPFDGDPKFHLRPLDSMNVIALAEITCVLPTPNIIDFISTAKAKPRVLARIASMRL